MSIYFEKVSVIRKGLIADIEEIFELQPSRVVTFAERVVIGEEEEKPLTYKNEQFFFGEHSVELKEFCTDDLVYIHSRLFDL